MGGDRTIVVCGATGRQGGAVSRHLIADGWRVRALTRRPGSRAAKALAGAGAEVVRADMADRASLDSAFQGVEGVFSVQNGYKSGFAAETEQGRMVAEAAAAAHVRLLVYASAGPGRAGTGVPSWDSKRPVEDRIRELGIPATILRPMAFMELMTDRSFFPAVGTWRIFPRLTGEDRAIPWLAVDDVGAIAAKAFADPEAWAGRQLRLAADLQTLGACRAMYTEVTGRPPRTFPMPIWLFDRFTRGDATSMWRWLATATVDVDPGETRSILPSALTVRDWLVKLSRPAASTKQGEERM